MFAPGMSVACGVWTGSDRCTANRGNAMANMPSRACARVSACLARPAIARLPVREREPGQSQRAAWPASFAQESPGPFANHINHLADPRLRPNPRPGLHHQVQRNHDQGRKVRTTDASQSIVCREPLFASTDTPPDIANRGGRLEFRARHWNVALFPTETPPAQLAARARILGGGG